MLSQRIRDNHTSWRTFSSGAVTTCFYDLGLSQLGFKHPTFRLRGLHFNLLRQRRGEQFVIVILNSRDTGADCWAFRSPPDTTCFTTEVCCSCDSNTHSSACGRTFKLVAPLPRPGTYFILFWSKSKVISNEIQIAFCIEFFLKFYYCWWKKRQKSDKFLTNSSYFEKEFKMYHSDLSNVEVLSLVTLLSVWLIKVLKVKLNVPLVFKNSKLSIQTFTRRCSKNTIILAILCKTLSKNRKKIIAHKKCENIKKRWQKLGRKYFTLLITKPLSPQKYYFKNSDK